ncbi:MAG: hypothetical protein GXX95_00915 [Methanomassiliicoccus sp.]|nr:hypothetical protein [Methanomassiliicoccus sp.]
MSISKEKEFEIRAYLSEDLATRNRAIQFFDIIESTDAENIVVNFANTLSISRSFADEYAKRKRAFKAPIREINVPTNIQKMFDVVNSPAKKKQVVNTEKLKIMML